MLIEKRKCTYYYKKEYAPKTKGIAYYSFKDFGNGSNCGWIICETAEEKEKYEKIIKSCGAANSNNLDYLIESGWNLDIIHKTVIEKMSSNTHRITKDKNNFFHVDGEDFCHHSQEEAIYWLTLEELK